MRNTLLGGMLALCCALAPGLARADRLVVVELFTSQGCDRCPPVDAMLSDLATRDSVLPLALHVDYWDYLGWTDQFALAENVTRQMAYVPLTSRGRLFTPLMVVGGLDPVEGYTPMQVMDMIAKHRAVETGVRLGAWGDGGTFRVTAEATQPLAVPATLMLVTYRPKVEVTFDRGLNAGRQVTYTNVVTDRQTLASWDGAAPLTLQVPGPEGPEGPVEGAILVQAAGTGFILAAARLR